MSEEIKNYGYINLPGGWKKTIDNSFELYKLYSGKFDDDNEDVELSFVISKLQDKFDELLKGGSSYTFEEIENLFDSAVKLTAEEIENI